MHKPVLLALWPNRFDEFEGLRDILESFAQVDARELSQEDLPQAVQNCEILLPCLHHTIDRNILDAAPNLRIVGTPSTGTDHIDVKELSRRNIELVCIKEDRELLDTVQSTAELAWLLVLACSRNFRTAITMAQQGNFENRPIRGRELIGKTIGIIGYGRLGSMVGRFAQAFRMHVIATDPAGVRDPWVKQVTLDELLAESDIITLHVHHTDETRGMIGREQFRKMKQGAIFVNTARGAIVDEDAMLDALENQHLHAAGIDVICNERAEDLTKLRIVRYAQTHDNLVLTPHIGGASIDAQSKVAAFFAEKLKATWQRIATD